MSWFRMVACHPYELLSMNVTVVSGPEDGLANALRVQLGAPRAPGSFARIPVPRATVCLRRQRRSSEHERRLRAPAGERASACAPPPRLESVVARCTAPRGTSAIGHNGHVPLRPGLARATADPRRRPRSGRPSASPARPREHLPRHGWRTHAARRSSRPAARGDGRAGGGAAPGRAAARAVSREPLAAPAARG